MNPTPLVTAIQKAAAGLGIEELKKELSYTLCRALTAKEISNLEKGYVSFPSFWALHAIECKCPDCCDWRKFPA